MSKEKFFLFRPRVLVLTIITLIIVTAILTPPIVIWKKRTKPIIILSDEDFEKYNFPGEGTTDNPYLIQDRKILTKDYYAIGIGNVTKHFIIQNNILKSNRYSIFLAITTSNIAKIINNTLEGEEAGIFITATPGCKIINNTFRNLHSGIGIFTLNDEINDYYVINNTFENIQYEEIIIVKSGNSIIENNTCTYENQEENQDIRKRGIFIINSPNVTIRNNYLTNKGITLSDNTLEAYLTKTVENNFVNGKEVGYLVNRENELIDEDNYSQLYLINCTNVNVTNLESNQCGIGIGLMYCTECSVEDCVITNQGWAGVAIYVSSFISLSLNNFDSNYRGIYATDSQNITISVNTISNSVYGCQLENCTYELDNNIFINNEVDIDD